MRKRNFRHILCILLLLAATTGCIRPEAFTFHGVSDVDFALSSSPAVRLVLDVENDSSYNLTVRDAAFTVSLSEGKGIGTVYLTEAVTLPRKSRHEVNVPLRITFDNLLNGLALLNDPEAAARRLYVSGEATVKAGCLKRCLTFDRMPLTEFMKRFGVALPAHSAQ